MQPTLTHVPPRSLRSTIAVLRPDCARRTAREGPACPAPITIASYFSVISVARRSTCDRHAAMMQDRFPCGKPGTAYLVTTHARKRAMRGCRPHIDRSMDPWSAPHWRYHDTVPAAGARHDGCPAPVATAVRVGGRDAHPASGVHGGTRGLHRRTRRRALLQPPAGLPAP